MFRLHGEFAIQVNGVKEEGTTDEAAAPKEEPEVKAEAAEAAETKAEPEVKVEAADTSGVEVVVKDEPADA